MGRQSEFTEALADEICGLMAEGESLRAICRRDGMPNVSTVLRWQGKHPEFAVQYAAAAEARMQHLFDEMREIADDSSKDWVNKPDGKGGTIRAFDHEHVQRAKLRVDTLKWALSRMDPGRFGDKIETTGTQDTSVTVKWGGPVSTLDRAKSLAAMLAEMGMKVVPADAIVLLPPAHVPEGERAGYGEHLVKIGACWLRRLLLSNLLTWRSDLARAPAIRRQGTARHVSALHAASDLRHVGAACVGETGTAGRRHRPAADAGRRSACRNSSSARMLSRQAFRTTRAGPSEPGADEDAAERAESGRRPARELHETGRPDRRAAVCGHAAVRCGQISRHDGRPSG